LFLIYFIIMKKKINIKTEDKKKIILVVDDDELIRLSIKSSLKNEYDIINMDNGLDALNYIRAGNHIDLITLDMEMPHMNGRVFIRRVKFDPTHNKIPIFLISATESRLIINSFLKLGVVDYLVKPFTQEELRQKIEKQLLV
jgi:CheY-like chemotaxis protein